VALAVDTAAALAAVATAKAQLTTAANLAAKPTAAQKTALLNAATGLDAVTAKLNTGKTCATS
jgi:hypothetical protein